MPSNNKLKTQIFKYDKLAFEYIYEIKRFAVALYNLSNFP